MKDTNFDQQASREVQVAREFLKAACGQQVSSAEASRSTLGDTFNFLTRYQAQPAIDPPLSLISKQWVPVDTSSLPAASAAVKSDKSILHKVFSQETAAKDQAASDAGHNGQGQVLPSPPLPTPSPPLSPSQIKDQREQARGSKRA